MVSQDVPDWTNQGVNATILNDITDLKAAFAATASGATTIISAVSAKKLVVRAMVFSALTAVNVKFQSHVTPTDISGLFYPADNGGFVLPYLASGWFETIAGEALDINLSAASTVGGQIVYGTL